MRRVLLLLLSVGCLHHHVLAQSVYEGSGCTLVDSARGVCVALSKCSSAKSELAAGRFPKVCSFDGFNPVVCCSDPQPATPAPVPVQPTSGPGSYGDPEPSPPPLSGGVSERMCTKYSSHVYEEHPPILIGGPKRRVSTCGIPGGLTFIVGGDPAKEKEFPHMAAVGYGPKDRVKWRCGGSLISEKYIMTAAHCIDTTLGKPRWVRLGILNVTNSDDENLQEFSVAKTIRHPEYSDPIKYHDIALLELDREVTFNSHIRPACLHTSRDIASSQATATGWGKVDYFRGNSFSQTLLKVDLHLNSNKDCRAKFSQLPSHSTKRVLAQGIVDDLMVCAGEEKGGKDACGGDSGGPFQIVRREPFCMYDIIAVTSFGKSCGEAGFPSVFTRVSNYVPWIESIVWPGEA